MTEPWLRFPVVCPECGHQELAALSVAVVAGALIGDSPIELYASCHDIYWAASPGEVARLRDVVAGLGLDLKKSPASNSASMQNLGIRRTKPPSQLTTPR